MEKSLDNRIQKAVLLVVFLLTSTISYAQNKKNRSYNEQLIELERENRFLKEDLARNQADLYKLQKDHKELSDKLDKYEPLLQNWQSYLGLFGITSLATIATAAWLKFRTLPSELKKIVDEVPAVAQREYEAKIAKLFTDRRADLIAILKEYDLEQEIKKNHRVVLLTHKNGTDDYHHDLLTKHGFEVHPYTRVEALAIVADSLTANDIIVINNEGGHWLPEDVKRFVHENPFNCFYIGRGGIDLEGEALNRFAAANFRAQFIGNLMNILKYRN